jgi:hypothetical protein
MRAPPRRVPLLLFRSMSLRPFVLRCAAALALFLALFALRFANYHPPLPNPLALELELDVSEIGRADPLIVAGRTGRGDFLAVEIVAENTVCFLYDSWGVPGLRSEPVPVRPGERLQLQIEIPALDHIDGALPPFTDRVRVRCNGRVVMDTEAHYYVRQSGQIWFAVNPLGGTSCGATLHGRLSYDGRELRGGAASFFPAPRDRLVHGLTRFPWQPASLLLFSVALVWGGPALLRVVRRVRVLSSAASIRALIVRHRWFVATTAVCTLVYTWLVTLGSFTLNYGEVFGSFYDYQAASLLQGRLDVPEAAIGGEAFEARGRIYGYFGPTPALLRLPFVMTGFAFGKLSRAFMLLYYVASLTAAYLILREALRAAGRHRPPEEDPVPSPVAVIVLLGSAGLGSTIFFVGSRGLVYHEAILGGIVFALWSCWCTLRHLRAPESRWWIGALACGILSVHTRPPTGLFALTFLGCAAMVVAYAHLAAAGGTLAARLTASRGALRRAAMIGAFCAVGFLSLNGLAYLKFGTFDAAPLRLSRPYTDPGRLENIDGKSFHVVNLPYNFYTYVVRPNFRIEPRFPWIYLGARQPGRPFPGARIDLPDHTLALPYAMPSLFALAMLGCAAAFLRLPRTRPAIVALWAACLPMTLALFAAVATAQRYTGDFCPFLIAAAAFGLVAIEAAQPRWRNALRGAALSLTLAAAAVTSAITLHYQGDMLWGVPEDTRDRYQAMRRGVDGVLGGGLRD